MDRDLPVSNVETLRESIGKSTFGSEFKRTNELGVRIALGAQRAQIIRLILLDGLRPALLGLIAGLAGSVAVAKLIRSLLYGIEPTTGQSSFLAVVTILLAVAVLAGTIPAWRASRLDPLQALRVE
jgi:ABC-type lipoprotein release transport system permease subunit